MPLYIASATGSVSDAELAIYVHDPAGAIRRDNDRRTTNVSRGVLRRVPKRTGTLAATLRTERGALGAKIYTDITIGRDGKTNYLGYILDGTPPHEILPRQDRLNPHLRFVVGGFTVFARRVFHPGTAPDNFLLKSLPDALL